MKQPQLARIERGQIPTLPTLQRLARALGAEFIIEPSGAVRVKALKQPQPAAKKARTGKAAAARKEMVNA